MSEPLAEMPAPETLEELLAGRFDLTAEEYLLHLFYMDDSLKAAAELPGQEWRDPILPFARYLKAHPEFEDDSGKRAWKRVSITMSNWGEPVATLWARNFGLTPDDAETRLMRWWEEMRSTAADDSLAYAVKLAQEDPLQLPDHVADRRASGYPLLVSTCYHLQRVRPNLTIYLPVRALGKQLGVDHTTAGTWIRQAVADGYLTKVADSVFHPQHGGRAAIYRFNMDVFH